MCERKMSVGACDINFVLYDGVGSYNADEAPELVEWFSISGDMDDFIYYGEETACSER